MTHQLPPNILIYTYLLRNKLGKKLPAISHILKFLVSQNLETMPNTYSVIATLRKKERKNSNHALIMLRITVNGQRAEISVKLLFKAALLLTFMLMKAGVFEARHCPTLLSEIKKTKLQICTSPQAGINILLGAVATRVTVYERESLLFFPLL